MKIRNDLTGRKFGMLRVLRIADERAADGKVQYHCQCNCGKQSVAKSNNLLSGNTKSCGCQKYRGLGTTTHGGRYWPEYNIFMSMRARCTNPKQDNYERYGGRGICCHYKSFKEFIQDVGRRPFSGAQINRINNDGDYEPGNVDWVTPSDNARNRRCCHA